MSGRAHVEEVPVKRPSPFKKIKKSQPKKVNLDQESLTRTRTLSPESSLPLVIEPAVADLDGVQWLANNRDFVEDRLAVHGALLFRGFRVESTGDFERFAGAICEDLYGEYGDLPPESGKVYGVTPYPPEGVILFHNESSHMHRWPMKQFFFCLRPAQSGGATPIVDCRELYLSLDPAERDKFERKQLRYVRNFIKGVDVSWRDFFKTERREEVEAYCARHGIAYQWKNEDDLATHQIAPAVVRHPKTGEPAFFNQIQLHHVSCLDDDVRRALLREFDEDDLPRNVYYGDGEPIADELVRKIEGLCWERAASFPWQSGDVLMVDNMLVCHGRKAYTPPRKMYVAMGQIMSQRELTPA